VIKAQSAVPRSGARRASSGLKFLQKLLMYANGTAGAVEAVVRRADLREGGRRVWMTHKANVDIKR
jgi:hypothetical protein